VVGHAECTTPVVILDAGHGGEDCGTIGINGVLEKDLNLAVSKYLAGYLRAGGIHTVETRTNDALLYDPLTVKTGHKKSTDLANRLAVSEKYSHAILISIHMNSFSADPGVHGLQVWYGQASPDSRALADIISKYSTSYLEADRKRAAMKATDSIFLLDRSTHAAVLIECGFLSNPADCAKLSDVSYQKQLSFVLFCAIMEAISGMK